MIFIWLLYYTEAYIIGCIDFLPAIKESDSTTCFLPYPDITVVPIYESSPMSEILPEIDLLLILSASEMIKNSIILKSIYYEIPTIVIGKGNNSDLVYFTEPPAQCYNKVLSNFINNQKMFNLGVIWMAEQNLFETAQALKAQGVKFKELGIDYSADKKKIKESIGKFLKSSGITDYLVLANLNNCERFEESFSELKLEKKWNIVVYGETCVYGIKRNGNFILAPLGTEYANTFLEYQQGLLEKFYNKIQGKLYNRFRIAEEFEKISTKCEYSIVNVQNSQKVKVGHATEKLIKFDQEIEYFAGSQERELLKKPKIQFSANTGSFNPLDQFQAYQNSRYQDSIYFALSKIRSSHNLLENFDLQLFDQINCGVSYFDYNYSKSCYESIKDNLGVAYIPSYYSSTIDTLLQFSDLGIKTPVLAGMGSSSILANSTMFPSFFRLVSPINYIIQISMIIMRKLTWKKIIAFYSDDRWGSSLYQVFLKQELLGNVEIINGLEFRKIPFNFKPSMLNDFKDHIKDAIDSGGNLVFLMMSDPTPYFFLEALYDYGIRRNDFVYVFFTPSGYDQIYADEGNRVKREELMDGTHMLYNSMWMGGYGYEIQKEYEKFNNKTWLPCFYIDAVYTIAHNLQNLIDQGRDFEDPEEFLNGLRNTRFLGATGVISFDPKGNSRNLYSFGVYNFYQNQTSQKYVGVNTTLVSPLTSQLLTYVPSVWPNGTPRPSEMKAFYYSCHIFERDVIESPNSRYTQLIICLAIVFLSCIITLLSQLKIKLTEIQLMTKVHYIQLSDYLELFFIIIEPIQMVSLGPPVERINNVFNWSGNFFSINLIRIYSMRDENFWKYFYFNFAAGYCWVILCLISTSLFTFLGKFHIKIVSLTNILTPIMTNYLFIPLITTALSVYSCQFSEKSNKNKAFLDTDCNYNCWKDDHIILIIFSSILIVLYTPIALVFKADWQKENNNLSIKSSEHYSMIKHLFSMLLITIQNPLRKNSDLGFALIFIACLITMLFYTFKRNAYNYDRANLWTKITICCVIWNTVVYIISLYVIIEIFWYTVIDVIGWIGIVSVGFVFHRRLPPSMLLVKEKNTVKMMLRFAFKSGMFNSLRYRVGRTGSLGPTRKTVSVSTLSKK